MRGGAVPMVLPRALHGGVFPVLARGGSGPWGISHAPYEGAAQGTENLVHKDRVCRLGFRLSADGGLQLPAQRLWGWARRLWPHTRDWTAMWRFHLDGRQQLEGIPQQEGTAETPTATNLSPVFAIHQIRALAHACPAHRGRPPAVQ